MVETSLILSPQVSGKCQLILIPGETREITLDGDIADFKELTVELEGERVINLPVEGFYPEARSTTVTVLIPVDIDISKLWSGRVRLGTEVFCEFEVKFLDPEHARSLGWRNG